MIRNFIYLDVEKMQSISSQIFEGVTEYIINESSGSTSNSEEQKGPVGSGRVVGDILKQQDKKSEKKFLNDYSYTLFEQRLIELEKVSDPTLWNDDKHTVLIDIKKSKNFIKIKGKAKINDIKSIKNLLENFNDLGKAIAYLARYEELEALREEFKDITLDKNSKSALQQEIKKLSDKSFLAKEAGFMKDQTFLDDLAMVLDYGFQDQLEITFHDTAHFFSANLKRDSLRESEDLIIRKYARKTEVDFILFGIITQYQTSEEASEAPADSTETMKGALIGIVDGLSELENAFIGRFPNEIIVDPIAIYTEL